jgi:predicted nucleotidyltransferase
MYKRVFAQQPVMAHGEDGHPVAVDTEAAVRTLEQYPVRLAVLFGSQVRGTATAESDVDVAVAFEPSLTAAERLEARVELTTALANALGTNAVDVTDLDSVRPAVDVRAAETGTVLAGDRETLEEYADRYERASGAAETHAERIRRFDALLERLDAQV